MPIFIVGVLGLASATVNGSNEPSEPALDAGSLEWSGKSSWISQDRLIVGLTDAHQAGDILQALPDDLPTQLLRVDDSAHFAVVKVDAGTWREAAEALRSVPGVRYVEPDTIVKATFVPNDPLYTSQWGLQAMHMPDAWESGTGSHAVRVGIIDTGIEAGHPDLENNLCEAGYDFHNDDADPHDGHFHGTHVAGTVAAEIDNGIGVAGMANACLVALKALSDQGWGYGSSVTSAIQWAADHELDIASMSLGGPPGYYAGQARREAMQNASEAGVLLVAAAANDGCQPIAFPAAAPQVMAVGAADAPGLTRSSFSNCGRQLEVTAPGRGIISTLISQYWYLGQYYSASGTSMAAPHVSGVAALLADQHPHLGANELRCLLRASADDMQEPGFDMETGFGMVNASRATAWASNTVACPAAEEWPLLDQRRATCETPGNDTTYRCQVRPAAFVDIMPLGASPLTLGDDQRHQYGRSFGFAFPFYDDKHSRAHICSNGAVMFAPYYFDPYGNNAYYNCPGYGAMPGHGPYGPNFVALLWNDLDPSEGGTIATLQVEDLNGRRGLIVQFTDVPHFYYGNPQTFQGQFWSDGCIHVEYLDADGVGHLSVGGLQSGGAGSGKWSVHSVGADDRTDLGVTYMPPGQTCPTPIMAKVPSL